MKKAITFLVLVLAISLSFGQTRPGYRIVPVSTLQYAVVVDIPANSLYTSITFQGRIVVFYTDSCTISFKSVKGNWRQIRKLSASTLASSCTQNNSTQYGALAYSLFQSVSLGNRTSGGTDTLIKLTASNKVSTGWITLHNGTTIRKSNGSLENCWNYNYLPSPYISIRTSSFRGSWYAYSMTTGKQPLPVSLLNFNAKCIEQGVVLKWSTGWERNSMGFEILTSLDGEHWRTLDFIRSKGEGGNSVEHIEYQFVDKEARASARANVYYRLRQMDLDKSEAYSDIIVVDLTAFPTNPLLSVHPNPLGNGEVLKLIWNENRRGVGTIRITDSHGREVFRSASNAGVLTEELKLNNGLCPGVYYLYCSDERSEEVIQLRFM